MAITLWASTRIAPHQAMISKTTFDSPVIVREINPASSTLFPGTQFEQGERRSRSRR
jgi:hypothetical protein